MHANDTPGPIHSVGQFTEIELLARSGDGLWSWRCAHDHRICGLGHLDTDGRRGTRLQAVVQPTGLLWSAHLPGSAPHPGASSVGNTNLVDHRLCTDMPASPRHTRYERGDLLLRRFRFTRSDNTGKASKLRPCLVMDIGDVEVRVRAVHGSNTLARRAGLGRRILDWKVANLSKPSVVTAEDHWMSFGDGGAVIGQLSPRDHRRLLEEE